MIHHVYANQSNVGDWLSAQGIQSLLRPWAVTEHFCDVPFVEETLTALGRLGERDLILIGGGGLFMDYFVPFWEGFRPIAARVPYVLWGVGCCDAKRGGSLPPVSLLNEIIRRSRLCVVRDELTRARYGGGALPPPVACPSVVAVPAPGAPEARLLHVDHLDLVGEAVYERMVAGARAYAQQTGRTYRQTNNRIPPRSASALAATLTLYASAEVVLASRLHGCILALAMGRPVLAVSGDRKIESFMRAVGLDSWVCDPDGIGQLPELLTALPRQPSAWSHVERAREENRRVAGAVRQIAEGCSAGQPTL